MSVNFQWDRQEISHQDVPIGAVFTTSGPNAALYVMTETGLALHLAGRGRNSTSIGSAPRLVKLGAKAGVLLDVKENLLIRPGDNSEVPDLYPELLANPKLGDVVLVPRGGHAIVADDSNQVHYVDTGTWSLLPPSQFSNATPKVRCIRQWTLWRETTAGPVAVRSFDGRTPPGIVQAIE